VYQAGTLSGNPLAMTAGIETVRALGEPGVWSGVAAACEALARGLAEAAREVGVSVREARAGTMLGLFFADDRVTDWESAKRADTERFAAFHRAMLDRGIYLPPSQFEAWFVSTAHGAGEIDATVAAAREAFASIPSPA
jgi:glutamate-1-semialdehyde 2,1-aminomutase